MSAAHTPSLSLSSPSLSTSPSSSAHDVPLIEAHRRPRWAVLLTTLVAGCALWFLQPHAALAAPKAAPAALEAATADEADPPARAGKKTPTGKLNLNTATAEQLMLLPGVGPSKAERVLAFRGKHGPFKRVSDLRRVKGFGYKTLKKLEPFLDVKGESTLAESPPS